MNDIIIVKPERCIGCSVCIRNCPAPEANIIKQLENGRLVTSVDPSKCIACGKCIATCKRQARDYLDDTESFMSHLEEEQTIIIVDPSLKIAYPLQWIGILDWFKSKNAIIFDGSFGADIYVWVFHNFVESHKIPHMISQTCSAVMNYINMYKPDLIETLPPIQSPAVCSAIYIKNYLKRTNRIAVLSPCIAKRSECAESELIDYSVTFKKLMKYFERNDIYISKEKPDNYDYPYIDQPGLLGALLTRPRGLSYNLMYRNPDLIIESADGVENVYKELNMFTDQADECLPDIYEVLSCEYGCNNGHGSGTQQQFFEITASMRALTSEIKGKLTKSRGFMSRFSDDKIGKRFDGELDISDFLRTYSPKELEPAPSDKELESAFVSMGKCTNAEKNYNCGDCGYSTCREMAVAIYRKRACAEGCGVYRKKLRAAQKTQYKSFEGIADECREITDKLKNELVTVVNGLKDSRKSVDGYSEKFAKTDELINAMIAFCSETPNLGKEQLAKLAHILESVKGSMAWINEHFITASSQSNSVNNSLADIDGMIDDINSVLGSME